MKKEMKLKWIEALRSGKYHQTRSLLRDSNGFCCLGVLADIKGCSWRPGIVGDDPVFDGRSAKKEGAQYLNEDFAELTREQQHKFARMNDDGLSFNEIADNIQKTIR